MMENGEVVKSHEEERRTVDGELVFEKVCGIIICGLQNAIICVRATGLIAKRTYKLSQFKFRLKGGSTTSKWNRMQP